MCGGDCKAFPDIDHPSTYPFLPGGHDPMAGKDYIIAPHRVVDHELERVMYGTGERVPMEDAIKYGLVEPPEVEPEPEPAEKPKRPKGKRKPAEDRARKPSEDR